MISPRFFALIPAAGVGARVCDNYPKQYLPIAGKPMLLHVLDTFAASEVIAHTFVVVNASDPYIQSLLLNAPHLAQRVTVLYLGGSSRKESVLNGLYAMRHHIQDDEWVLVHDAARPGLTGLMIQQLVDNLRDDPVGGLLAMPIVDTIKAATIDNRVQSTVPRVDKWAAQTPQMFRYATLSHALETSAEVTDESSAIEALKLMPKLITGSPRNFKVTLPHDLALAEVYLKGLA